MNSAAIGVSWALVGMVSWGFGDYFIQRTSRAIGIWRALFFISIVGSIGLTPFILGDFHEFLNPKNLLFLGLPAFAMTVSSIFYFQALKDGKLAIMEPILSAELPLAAILAVVLWRESLGMLGWLLVLIVFIGNALAATEHHSHLHYHKRIFEKGVIYALVAALCMAFVDLLMGVSSQEVSPLFTVWVVWVFSGAVSTIYLMQTGEFKKIKEDIREHRWMLLALGVFDTMGWVGFCLGAIHIPIAITTAIGESYIVITMLLGFFLNHERLRPHQKWGVAFAVVSVIALAAFTG